MSAPLARTGPNSRKADRRSPGTAPAGTPRTADFPEGN